MKIKMSKFFRILFIISIIYPLIVALHSILSGMLPFGYDPARDLLLAQDNLRKPTLLGPPGGIPGIFYGPYWIWLLSVGLIFSRDPRFIAILILVIPYFILFIGLLLKLSKIIGKRNCILLWLLFFFSYPDYINDLWHPHLAPIILLGEIYLLVDTEYSKGNKKNYLRILLAGILSGLVVNFHLSFGSAVLLGSIAYFLFDFIISILSNPPKWKFLVLNRLIISIVFLSGIFIVFLPSLIFEFRHGFHQMQAAVKAVTDSVIYNTSSVGQVGLNKNQILSKFFGLPSYILQISNSFVIILFLTSVVSIVYKLYRKSFQLIEAEKKLLIFLTSTSFIILLVYLTSKNPIWSYHFIGTEIIILLFIGWITSKISLFRWCLSVWVVVLLFSNLLSFIKSLGSNPYTVSSLATKKYIVEKIYQDSEDKPFSVFAYSPSLYTFDYDYLFRWLGREKYQQEPQNDVSRAEFVYLIIPQTQPEILEDFIHYRTNPKQYKTVREWKIDDGTIILKREKYYNHEI